MNSLHSDVVVVIPNWNGTERLRQCLQSLHSSSLLPTRVIVVDNGSNDITELEACINSFHLAMLLKNSANEGFSKAVNRGMDYAMTHEVCNYIWILNNDTIADNQALQRMVLRMEKENRLGICGSALRYPSGNIVEWGGGFLKRWTGLVRSCKQRQDLHRGLDFISGASMLVRREVIKEIGTFDPRYFFYWEDIDYCYRAKSEGWQIDVEPEAEVSHEQGASLDMFHPLKIYHFNRGAALFFCSYYPKTAISPISISACARIAKGAILGRWHTIPAICKGMAAGIGASYNAIR